MLERLRRKSGANPLPEDAGIDLKAAAELRAKWQAEAAAKEAARPAKTDYEIRLQRLLEEKQAQDRAAGRDTRINTIPPDWNRRKWSLTPSPGSALIGIAALALAGDLAGAAITNASYNSEEAADYLKQEGYSDVRHTGTDTMLVEWRGCGSDDEIKFDFTATAPDGEHVREIVCKGIFKAATSREG